MKLLRVKPEKIPPALRWVWGWLPANGQWFVAGGAVRSIVDKTAVSDIDLFSTGSVDREYLEALLRANGCRRIFACPEGLLYTWQHRSGLKIQVILEVVGPPSEVLRRFDFTACQFAMTSAGEVFSFSPQGVSDAARKRLRSASITYPHASLRRMFKYEQKGYRISDGEIFSLVRKCAEIPLDEQDLWRRYID